jgi:hypothetical protein
MERWSVKGRKDAGIELVDNSHESRGVEETSEGDQDCPWVVVPMIMIIIRSPVGAKDFSSNLYVQTGYGAHPASCIMGTRGTFSGGKNTAGTWRWLLTPSSAEVENE